MNQLQESRRWNCIWLTSGWLTRKNRKNFLAAVSESLPSPLRAPRPAGLLPCRSRCRHCPGDGSRTRMPYAVGLQDRTAARQTDGGTALSGRL